jgi:hypothetical protein
MNRPGPDSPDQSANKDEDAVWLDLVARLEAMPGEKPDAADASADLAGTRGSFSDFDPLGLSRPASDAAPVSAATGPRDYEVNEDEEGFVPEEPPSLAGTEPLTMLAWIGAAGGPLALLFTAMFWRSAPLPAVLGMVAAFLASVVYLITRLPREKDDYDDGARI